MDDSPRRIVSSASFVLAKSSVILRCGELTFEVKSPSIANLKTVSGHAMTTYRKQYLNIILRQYNEEICNCNSWFDSIFFWLQNNRKK
jgi:hypothetical protein